MVAGDWEKKLDARLRARLARAKETERDAEVSVFVRFRGSANDLAALGLAPRWIAGDIATASVPIARLEALARAPAVVFVEAAGGVGTDTE